MSGAPLLSDVEVSSYLDAVDWLESLLGQPELTRAWDRPSALQRYTTGGVAAHAVFAGVVRLVQLLGEPEPATDRPVRVADYYGPNRVAAPDDDDPLFVVLREGAEKAARRGPAVLLETCRGARAELAHALPLTRADRPIAVARIRGGFSPAGHYLRTRILEVVVHGDDLVASVPELRASPPPQAALEVCLQLCLELARAQSGDTGVLRAFTRAERADPGALRIL